MGDLNMLASPLSLKLDLTRSGDFMRALEPINDTTFPEGSAITFEFTTPDGEVKWPATVTPTLASWHVDKAQVDALIAAWGKQTTRPCRLRYAAQGGELIWATTNKVVISG